MMKKGILIGVLAVLMLMAFTACEQSPTTPLYGAQVESVTVAEQPLYIVIPSWVGVTDTIDQSAIKFNVKYNDGKVYTYTGAQLGITGTVPVSDLTTTIKVDLDPNNVDKYVFYPQVKAYAATGATIDLSSIKGPVEIEDSTEETVLVKATVASAGGSKEFDYSFKVKASDISKLIKDNELKAGNTFTVKAEYATTLGKTMIDTAKAKGLELAFTGSVDVTVANPSARVSDFSVTQETKIYPYIGTDDGITALEDAGLTITPYDKDGKPLSEVTSGFEVFDADGIKFNAAYTWDKAGTYNVTVKYNGISKETTITVSEDYPVTYEATQNPTEGEEKKDYYFFEYNETIDLSKVAFTITKWDSGRTNQYTEDNTPEYTKPVWTAIPDKIPSDVAINQSSNTYGLFQCRLSADIDGVTATWKSGDGLRVVKERPATT